MVKLLAQSFTQLYLFARTPPCLSVINVANQKRQLTNWSVGLQQCYNTPLKLSNRSKGTKYAKMKPGRRRQLEMEAAAKVAAVLSEEEALERDKSEWLKQRVQHSLDNTRDMIKDIEADRIGPEEPSDVTPWFDTGQKILADFSLVGLANSGKTSLFRALTGSYVKFGLERFITKEPHLGSSSHLESRPVSILDLPSLEDVYGYHRMADLKNLKRPLHLRHTSQLRYVERTRCILLVLDVLGHRVEDRHRHNSPLVSAYIAMDILERWSGGTLLDKPFVCVLNKMDRPSGEFWTKYAQQWLERWDTAEAREESGLPDIMLPSRVPRFEGIHVISVTKKTNTQELDASLPMYLDRIKSREAASGHNPSTNSNQSASTA